LTIVASLFGLSVVLIGGLLYLNRPRLVTIEATVPESFPAKTFSHEMFESLLARYVDSQGNVDYAAWHDARNDRLALDHYLAAVASFSPESAPERFPRRSEALAYWIYAYNACVIRSVLEKWPLASVTDVKAPIEVVKGLGFFYQQRFVFGGIDLSLYTVEHDKILDAYRDPRIHFVLNCASASCPVLRPELPTGDDLEVLLSIATLDFVSDPRNVRVDHERRQVLLSSIFKWYRNDFVNDLRRRGLLTATGVLGYIREAGSMELQAELAAAEGYDVVFNDYDWAINSQDY